MPDVADSPELRKERGAFFTPPVLAQFIADWAVRSKSDRVLEPSCGDAVFLLSAGQQLHKLGSSQTGGQLHGHDIHSQSLIEAASVLAAIGIGAKLIEGDFFDAPPEPSFDAVIGNPPYIRFQGFSGASRSKSLARALAAGVNLSGLASSWAAFVIHSSMFLKTGGRLGLVLPAELLSVKYAAPVRKYLLQHFSSIELLLFDELVFSGVQTDIVVLLADGFRQAPSNHFKVYQARNVESIGERVEYGWKPPTLDARWTDALLSTSAAPILIDMQSSGLFGQLAEWGTLASGTVTGANKYFALSPTEAEQHGLDPSDLKRLLPPGTSLMSIDRFNAADWSGANPSAKTLLFHPRLPLNESSKRYIELGEAQGLDTRYKCRVRSPWWRVPVTTIPDLFVSYMSGSTPRIVSNPARTHHLNSIHGLRVLPELRDLASRTLPMLALSSYSLLSAEIEGRSYGGGILKLEPREAGRWLVPNPETAMLANELHGKLLNMGSKLIRSGDIVGASEIADQIVGDLLRGVSLIPLDSIAVKSARSDLLRRRLTRGRQKTASAS